MVDTMSGNLAHTIFKEEWDSVKQQRFVEGALTSHGSILNIVGQHAATKLKALGITQSHQLVGFYMVQNLDDDKFKHWLEHTVGISHRPSREYYTNTVRKWCIIHLGSAPSQPKE